MGAMIRCPACDQQYEDDLKERRIPINGYDHHVCKPCYVAWLKIRVKTGARLDLGELHSIGKVRKKFKSIS